MATTAQLKELRLADIPCLRAIYSDAMWAGEKDLADRALAKLELKGQLAPDGRPFVWGEIIQIHEIGDIKIVESWRDHPQWRGGQEVPADETDIGFHPYINDEDTSHSYDTLDQAVLGALGYKYLDLNNRFEEFASRMLLIGGR